MCHTVLNPNGRYISVAGDLADAIARGKGTKKSIGGQAAERAQDFHELVQLARRGIFKPVIDRTYKFDQMREAHAYVETGRKKGSVVIGL